ncbi:hypothetical protein SCUP515_13098 [Seiridium cupressi]
MFGGPTPPSNLRDGRGPSRPECNGIGASENRIYRWAPVLLWAEFDIDLRKTFSSQCNSLVESGIAAHPYAAKFSNQTVIQYSILHSPTKNKPKTMKSTLASLALFAISPAAAQGFYESCYQSWSLGYHHSANFLVASCPGPDGANHTGAIDLQDCLTNTEGVLKASRL